MNSLNELVSYGFDEKTAQSMVYFYNKRIGKISGDYKITDVTYNHTDKTRDVELTCVICGNKIYRKIPVGKNKWDRLVKICRICKKEKRKNDFEEKQKEQKEALETEVGKRYGDYIVSSVIDQKPPKLQMVCTKCGASKNVAFYMVREGIWNDYKCHKHYSNVVYDESYIGLKYGNLTIIGLNETGNKKRFVCKCNCGEIKSIRPVDLITGRIKSCGCKHDEYSKTHGGSKERLYHVWQGMRRRCESEKSAEYNNYGGRGITVCDEWRDYSAFRDWAYLNGYDENAPFGECTIDRIDVNGNYEPNNCRWITIVEQQKNKRPYSEWQKPKIRKKTALILFDGRLVPKTDLCKQYGISVETFNYRYIKKGMSVEAALSTPKMTEGRPRKAGI